MIRIYDVPISGNINNIFVKGEIQKIYETEIHLNDTMEKQYYTFSVEIPDNDECYSAMLLLEFEILDIYKGTDYDDTAISEIEVFGDYISNDN